jgi:hypothetical protein
MTAAANFSVLLRSRIYGRADEAVPARLDEIGEHLPIDDAYG